MARTDPDDIKRNRAVKQFQEKHPLAQLYISLTYMGWARDDREWLRAGGWADAVASSWASLSDEWKAKLSTVMPNPPDPLGDNSDQAWCFYIGSLWAVKAMRLALIDTIRQLIYDEWGAEYMPLVSKAIPLYKLTEPDF